MSRYFYFLLILTLSLTNAAAQKKKADILIQAATIVDIEHGKLIKGKTIAVKGLRIIAVVNNQEANSFVAANTINAKGKYVMPGLWDMHMHFGGGDSLIEENKNLLMLYLANGITSVRDCAADISPSVLQWRKAINEGLLEGPTIYTAGPKLEGYKSIWVGDIEVDNSDELNKAIDSLEKIKVDFVKITDNTMKPDLYLEALKETRKRGFQITGHIPAALTLTQVSNAGLSAIEHIGYLLRAGNADEAGFSAKIAAGQFTARDYNKLLLQQFDTAAAMKVYKQLAKNGTAVVPTLSISYTVAYLDQDDHKNDDYLQYIGRGLRNTYNWRVQRAAKDPADAVQFRHELFERSAGLLPLLNKAGVKIIAGTDAGYLNSFDYPGLSLHKELALMVKYGLTPLQALQASVINGPAFFKKETMYGSIVPGKIADLLLLDENPLQNITATEKINTVIVKGEVYNRQRLDALMQEAKRRAAAN